MVNKLIRFRISAVSLLIKKALCNFHLDITTLFSSVLPLRTRVIYLCRKYAALLLGKRQIEYLGHAFSYDNRWTPALLQAYPSEIDLLAQTVPFEQLKAVLDIGANTGQFTATLLYFFPHLEVVSFEPNPLAFALLKKNSSWSTTWRCVHAAIGLRDGEVPLYFVPDKTGQGSFVRENADLGLLKRQVISTSVPVRRPDRAYMHSLGVSPQFDLIKIDVEGSEKSVLAGLVELDWRFMVIECSHKRVGSLSESEVIEILTDGTTTGVEVLSKSRIGPQDATYSLTLRRNP